MKPRIFVPGWGGSGAGHWQTLWQSRSRGARRVEMPDWFAPDPEAWVQAIDRTVARAVAHPGPSQAPDSQLPVLIAHSLGCIATARWLGTVRRPVAAALLVAPPDVEREGAPEALRAFAPMPRQRLPLRTVVVASTNDTYATLDYATTLARQWGSELVVLQDAGHINVESGHGPWPQGLALLRQLLRE
ncbi:MAG TPA: alpha/beta hydrolase [Kofleriaceae bacterium]|nr:alpha/beta hydrolase [Kofleriaceae bacterium]